MKKIIVTLIITGSLNAQDDIIIKSAGTDATKGILFQKIKKTNDFSNFYPCTNN